MIDNLLCDLWAMPSKLVELLLLVFIFFSASTVSADTLTLVADEWCPYNCSPESKSPGFLIEIAELVFSSSGHKISYQVMPWARAIEESRAGKFNAIVGAVKEDAPDFIYPEVGMAPSDDAVFVKSGSSWRYESIKSFDKVSVGVIQDYAYEEELDQYIEANKNNPDKVQIASGEDALQKNIDKLLSGRLDVLVDDSKVVRYYLKNRNLVGKIVPAGTIGSEEQVFIAFSPKDPQSKEYAKLLSDGMRKLEASGKLKEILAKYGL